jgi:hypothetical protein
MATYRIINIHTGADFGAYEGKDAADAVARMQRQGGYDVEAEDGRLLFPDEETAKLCGDLGEAWDARPAGE